MCKKPEPVLNVFVIFIGRQKFLLRTYWTVWGPKVRRCPNKSEDKLLPSNKCFIPHFCFFFKPQSASKSESKVNPKIKVHCQKRMKLKPKKACFNSGFWQYVVKQYAEIQAQTCLREVQVLGAKSITCFGPATGQNPENISACYRRMIVQIFILFIWQIFKNMYNKLYGAS